MEYSCNTHGILMEYSWNTHGILMEDPWNFHGILMEYPRNTHGLVIEYTWNGIHMEYPRNTHGINHTWNTPGSFMEYTWSKHRIRSCSVMLCRSLSWMLLATGIVISQAIVCVLCCTLDICPGVISCADKNKLFSPHDPNYQCKSFSRWKIR